MEKPYDYLFVGSGLTNAVIARKKLDEGRKVLVIEKSSYIGGVCHTYKDNGITVHNTGAHIFHTSDEEVWSFVNKYATFKPFINSPKAIWNGNTYSLPFNLNTFCEIWPDVKTAEDAKKKIEGERAHFVEPKNLEEQALNLVGPTIYERLIKGYTEKQWGTSCTNLSPDIIKRLPLRFEKNNNYFNDKYQGVPEEGYTGLISNLLQGAEIKRNVNFLRDRQYWLDQADVVYCSCPVDDLMGFRLGNLGFRSLHFFRRNYALESYQEQAVMNHTDHSVPYTRTIEHKKFLGETGAITIVDFEHPECFIHGYNEPLYPINNADNNKLYEDYVELAGKEYPSIVLTGRNGLYRYMDMDDCIRWALDKEGENGQN